MSDLLNPNLDRRTFVKGAATAVAGTALAGSSVASQFLNEVPVVSVAYFDGHRLIPVEKILSGDRSLDRLEVTIESKGKGSLRGINVNFPVTAGNGVKPYPFRAWESGGLTRKFEVPVDPKTGVSLTVLQGTPKAETALTFNLGLGTAKGAKLREGTYVVAAGRVNWSNFRFEAEDPNGPVLDAGAKPTNLQYALITIGRI